MADVLQVGQRFVRLVTLRYIPRVRANWLCLCDCGIEKSVSASHLRSGAVVSCGCFARERKRQHGRRINLTHGHTKNWVQSPTWKSWQSMMTRCTNPKVRSWPRYGGRGIKVCERWTDFANFLDDMGERPAGMSIERKDGDGDYHKDNCRWATSGDQTSNRRSSRHLSHGGTKDTMSGWARRLETTKHIVRRYAEKHGDGDAIAMLIREKALG